MSVAGTQVGKQEVRLTSNRLPLREVGFVVPVCSADYFRDFPRLYHQEMIFLGKLQLFQKARLQSPHSLGQGNPLFVSAGSVCLRPEPEPARGEGPAQARQLCSWIYKLQGGSSSGSF